MMKARAVHRIDDGAINKISVTEDIDDGEIDLLPGQHIDAEEEVETKDENVIILDPGDSPTLYTTLLFFDGFNVSYFHDMFNFLLKADPTYGLGTHGYLSRFMPQRCYVMHKKPEELENGGWKSKPEFKEFLLAVEGVSESAGLQQSGREYFKRVPDLFLRQFRHFLVKRVLNTWRSDDKLHYILGGHPVLAKSFAQMLVHYVEVVRDKPNDLMSRYTFQNEDFVLPEHHKMMHGRIKIKVCDAMCWLTSGANLEDIVSERFGRTHWDMIKTCAEEEDI